MPKAWCRFLGVSWVLAAVLACSGNAFAQTTTSLRGTVQDVQGLALPAVVLTLTNVQNGASRKVLSEPAGEHAFLPVLPGTYQLSANKSGFTTATRDDIQLLVNTPATLDLQLQVGTVSEPVHVTAET